jgi:hypothetical protein
MAVQILAELDEIGGHFGDGCGDEVPGRLGSSYVRGRNRLGSGDRLGRGLGECAEVAVIGWDRGRVFPSFCGIFGDHPAMVSRRVAPTIWVIVDVGESAPAPQLVRVAVAQ